MATIEKIVHRPDGKIGVWTSPKVEIEFDDLDHIRTWCLSPPTDIDDATLKEMLLEVCKGSRTAKDAAIDQRVSCDSKLAAREAVAKGQVRKL